jgi:hypothetical protein
LELKRVVLLAVPVIAVVALLMRFDGRAPTTAPATSTAVTSTATTSTAAPAADPRTCAVDRSNIRVTESGEWEARFHAYGDSNVSLMDWTGGDGGYTIPLPDGRRLWLFGDTYLGAVDVGPVDHSHGRSETVPLINNSVVVEARDKRLSRTLRGGTTDAPRAYVDAGVTTPTSWYWPGAGAVEGTRIRLLLNRFHHTGTGGLDFAFEGTAIASIELPSLAVVDDPARLPVLNLGGVVWNHVLEQPDAHYVYGTKDRNLYLARSPAGNLLGPWSYHTGGGWSSDPAAATPIIGGGAGGDTHVAQVNNSFVRLSVHSSASAPFGNVIRAYFSCSPAGPWTQTGVPIYTTPEAKPGSGTIVYDAYIHQESVTGGSMLANYSVIGFPDAAPNHRSVHVYRPRFLRITIRGLP